LKTASSATAAPPNNATRKKLREGVNFIGFSPCARPSRFNFDQGLNQEKNYTLFACPRAKTAAGGPPYGLPS
jgi:hypothetical protein